MNCEPVESFSLRVFFCSYDPEGLIRFNRRNGFQVHTYLRSVHRKRSVIVGAKQTHLTGRLDKVGGWLGVAATSTGGLNELGTYLPR